MSPAVPFKGQSKRSMFGRLDRVNNYTSTSTRTSTSSINMATSKPITLTMPPGGTSPSRQDVNDPSQSPPASSVASSGISSATEVSSSQHRIAEAALLGTIFGILLAVILTIMVVVIMKCRKRKRRRQQVPDPDNKNSAVGSAVNAEYHPQAATDNKRPVARTVPLPRSVGDTTSRIWGGSELAPSEYGTNERTPNVPAMPMIPAVYNAPGSRPREALGNRPSEGTDHRILSRGFGVGFGVPRAPRSGPNAASVRNGPLENIRDERLSGAVSDRESIVSVPRFRTAESWVADQRNRLQRGR